MMKITGLSHLFKWENLHNWWLTKYFFAPLYIIIIFLIVTVFHNITAVRAVAGVCGAGWALFEIL